MDEFTLNWKWRCHKHSIICLKNSAAIVPAGVPTSEA